MEAPAISAAIATTIVTANQLHVCYRAVWKSNKDEFGKAFKVSEECWKMVSILSDLQQRVISSAAALKAARRGKLPEILEAVDSVIVGNKIVLSVLARYIQGLVVLGIGKKGRKAWRATTFKTTILDEEKLGLLETELSIQNELLRKLVMIMGSDGVEAAQENLNKHKAELRPALDRAKQFCKDHNQPVVDPIITLSVFGYDAPIFCWYEERLVTDSVIKHPYNQHKTSSSISGNLTPPPTRSASRSPKRSWEEAASDASDGSPAAKRQANSL